LLSVSPTHGKEMDLNIVKKDENIEGRNFLTFVKLKVKRKSLIY